MCGCPRPRGARERVSSPEDSDDESDDGEGGAADSSGESDEEELCGALDSETQDDAKLSVLDGLLGERWDVFERD